MASQHQLVIAVHHVATPTAKVPFAMILLLDFAKRKATPQGCKCRMVLPSDGETSISMWDTQDPQSLHEWLNDNLGADCTTTLHEVQEDFTWGLSLDLARMRAADRVGETTSKAAGVLAAGVTTAVGSTHQTLEAFDQRTKVISTAKETTAVIAQKAIGVMSKAAEDRRVQGVVSNVSTGWAKLSGWVGDRMRDININDGAEEYGYQGQPQRGYSPTQEQVHMPSQYASSHTMQSQPQHHTLSSTSGAGGLPPTGHSMEQPLTSTSSMHEEPALAVPAETGRLSSGTAGSTPAAPAATAIPAVPAGSKLGTTPVGGTS